jgi:hypothetical protein
VDAIHNHVFYLKHVSETILSPSSCPKRRALKTHDVG